MRFLKAKNIQKRLKTETTFGCISQIEMAKLNVLFLHNFDG